MSKMDALRKMREDRYDQMQARTKGGAASPRAARRPAPAPVAPATPVTDEPETAGEELCGHKSMNGRTCTRERGHAAKSHRYS